MSDLAAWLLEQIDADERELRGWQARLRGQAPWVGFGNDWTLGDFNLERAMAECEAKHRIVEEHWDGEQCWTCVADVRMEYGDAVVTHKGQPYCPTLRLLASVYADRPGYDESWRA